jgi:hypothetical protein
MFHHEMWLDEAQAFLLARDSEGLLDLWKNLRYEGHTGLWHLIVYGLLKVWSAPYSVQVLHFLIGLSIIGLVLFRMPFSLTERILLSCSYFLSYEYLIVSRNYSIGVLLILLATQVYLKWDRKWILLLVSILLGLAVNTSFPALLVSVAMFGVFVIDQWIKQGKTNILRVWCLGGSIIFMGAAILLAYLELRPFPDRTLDSKPDLALNVFKGLHLLKDVGESLFFFPTMHWNTPWNWETDALPKSYYAGIFVVPMLLFVLLLVTLTILVRKNRNAILMVVFGIGLLFLFNYVVKEGAVRHNGFYLLTIICAYWIWRDMSSEIDVRGRTHQIFQVVLLVMLGFQVWASFHYHFSDIRYTFSDAKGVAHFLDKKHIDSEIVVFSPQYAGPPIIWYSGMRNGFYVETNEFQSFLVYTKKAKLEISQKELLESARRLNSNTLVFLDNWETLLPNDSLIIDAGYSLVYRTDDKHILTPGEERFRVYSKNRSE